MGHLLISGGCCRDQLRSTTFYEPHDTTHRQAGPWQVVLAPVAPPVRSELVSNQLSNNGG